METITATLIRHYNPNPTANCDLCRALPNPVLILAEWRVNREQRTGGKRVTEYRYVCNQCLDRITALPQEERWPAVLQNQQNS